MNESEPLMKCGKRTTFAKSAFHHWAEMKIMDLCKADYLQNSIYRGGVNRSSGEVVVNNIRTFVEDDAELKNGFSLFQTI